MTIVERTCAAAAAAAAGCILLGDVCGGELEGPDGCK